MSVEITTKKSGEYTHYFAKHPRHWDGELYIGLSAPYYRDGEFHSDNFSRSLVRTIISFNKAYYTADERAFLPAEIIVDSTKIDEFIKLGAEWYVAEYDAYLDGIANDFGYVGE